jgi:arylsulfatase A-like enzyme
MKRQGIPEWRQEELTVPLGPKEQALYSYAFFFAHDVTIDRASDFLWGQHPVQVFSTYFRLVDVTSHFADHFVDRRVHDEVAALAAAGEATAADLARLDLEVARVMAPTYQFMDRIVAKYLERMNEHTALIVCSDHGFHFLEGHYDHRTGPEAPDGVLLLAGPGVRKGGRISGARLFDIAPTILHWMGLPVAEDMDGDVLPAAVGGSKRASVRRIATYETGERTRGSSSTDPVVSAQALEDLRALGYIEGPAEAPPRPSPTPGQR